MELDDYYPEVELKEAICKKVAIFKIAGLSTNAIAKQMGVPVKRAKIICESVECAHFVKQIGNAAVKDFRDTLIREVSTLVPLMVETLREHLENKNLQAIPHALKIMGFDKEVTEQSSQIQVFLPGDAKPTTIEVKPEKVE